ncbi:MAG: class I SAM-dependent methyltransferase [Candidatus Micrarchaeota archaeon]
MPKSKSVREGYEKIAKEYHKRRDRYKNTILLEKFRKNLPKGSWIIDLGCGAGVPVAKFLAGKGYKVTGIDFSKEMLRLARKNVPKAKFIRMDMTKMRFGSDSFDGAVSFYAMIHVPREKHAGIYRKLHRILKPGGIILVNAGGSDRNGWEGYEKDYMGVPMFWSFYGPERTSRMIMDAGFEILWSRILELGGEKQFWVLARNRKGRRA